MIKSYDLSECSHLVDVEVAYLASMKTTIGLRFVSVCATNPDIPLPTNE